MNLCTDQLAMLLAAPGQLASVSDSARDKRASAMVEEAMANPDNHGRAEKIYLLQADLVVVFQSVNALEDVRARVFQMGEVLAREDTAEALLAD